MGGKSNYSEAYKREAVTKAKASGNVSQTARKLGISGVDYCAPDGCDFQARVYAAP